MMRRLLFVGVSCLSALLGLVAIGGGEFTGQRVVMVTKRVVTAASCSSADVQAAVNSASDGYTVRVPAGSCTWTSGITVSSAITLRGASDCTLDGVGGWPTSCPTVITDGMTTGTALIDLGLVASKLTRLSHLQLNNGGTRSDGITTNGLVRCRGPVGADAHADGRRCRVDHVFFNAAVGTPEVLTHQLWWDGAYGVADHNNFQINGGLGVTFFRNSDFDYGDARLAGPAAWGTDEFAYLENNLFYQNASTVTGITDADTGARFVARYNTIRRGVFSCHGTESGGRKRGCRAVEIYGNTEDGDNGSGSQRIATMRSGTSLVWGNTLTDYQTAARTAVYLLERAIGLFRGWETADGTNPWDVNDAGNPFATMVVATVPTTRSLTVSGASWTTDQWRGYHLKNTTNCTPAQLCGTIIETNTSNTLNWATFSGTLQIAPGDTFTLNKVTHGLDAPCRTGGTLLVALTNASVAESGGVVTVRTATSHGLTTGDKVSIHGASPTAFRGLYTVTVIDADEFTYPALSGATGNASSDGQTTKIPAGWNNQVTEPCYDWLNTDDGSNIVAAQDDYIQVLRGNEHFYSYGGTVQSSPTSPFNGTTGVGVGTIANRPTTCTAGVAYWATDEGEWNSLNAGADGRLYKAIAANTWALYYTPYIFPHPLAR